MPLGKSLLGKLFGKVSRLLSKGLSIINITLKWYIRIWIGFMLCKGGIYLLEQ